MGYFDQIEFVSNSELSELKRSLSAKELPKGIEKTFSFGNLVEDCLQRPGSLDVSLHELSAVEIAKEMALHAKEDRLLNMALKYGRHQHEFYKRLHVEYEGYEFTLPFRCKTDIDIKSIGLILDIKTTAATSQDQFNAAFYHFDMDRQGSIYLDATKYKKCCFVGIGKKKNKFCKTPIFHIPMEVGDERYKSGKLKYSKLCYQYKMLIQPLTL